MQTNELRDVATTLRTARLTGEPVAAPTQTWPALDADAAFEVQKINVDRGRRRRRPPRRLQARQHRQGHAGRLRPRPTRLRTPAGRHFRLRGHHPGAQSSSSSRSSSSSPPSCCGAPCAVPTSPSPTSSAPSTTRCPPSRSSTPASGTGRSACPTRLADNGSTGAVILGGTPRQITDLDPARHPRRAAVQRPRSHRRKHRQHPRQPARRRRLAVQPARRLRRRIRTRPGHPSRQLPASRPDERGRPLVGHLRGLGHNRIRCFKRITTPRPNRAERQDEIRTDLEQNALSTYPTLYGLITMGLTRHE